MVIHCFHCIVLGCVFSLVLLLLFVIFYFIGKHVGKEIEQEASFKYCRTIAYDLEKKLKEVIKDENRK